MHTIPQLNKAGDGIPSPWEHPGKATSLEGHCLSSALMFLPTMVLQRVTTLEPSRR